MARGQAMLSSWIQTTVKRWTHFPSHRYPLFHSLSSGSRLSLLSLSLLGASLASVLLPLQEAYGAQLTRWLFDPTTHWLTLSVPGGTAPQYFLLAQPPRIVVDLPNTQVHNVPELRAYSGMVQSIRVGQFQPELTRIVIEFEPNVTFAPGHITIQSSEAIASPDAVAEAETWYIRPLLVGQNDNAALPPGLMTSQGSGPETVPENGVPVDNPDAPNLAESASLPETLPDVLPGALTSETATTPDNLPDTLPDNLPNDFASRNLPPLEPGALEIPIDVPDSLPEPLSASLPESSPESLSEPLPEASPEVLPESTDEPELEVALNDEQNSDVSIDETEPIRDVLSPSAPAITDSESTPPLAGVTPPLAGVERLPDPNELNEPVIDVEIEGSQTAIAELPLADLPAPETAISEPPLANLPAPETAFLPPMVDAPPSDTPELTGSPIPALAGVDVPEPAVSTITFGQDFRVDVAPGVVTDTQPAPTLAAIPTEQSSHVVVSLRYPRETSLHVKEDSPRQEVLVVTRAVSDRANTIVIPEGSLVIGRFERMAGEMDGQLRFTPQALTMGDRTIRLENASMDLVETAIEPNQLIQITLDATVLEDALKAR